MRRLIVLAFVLMAAWADDWPQWRGPHRDGIAAGFVEPKAWPEKLTLKWKVTVGEGHSSPIVAAGAIYTHTRQGDREVVTALRPADGQTLWQEGYPAPYTMNPAATSHGKGVKSTPVVEDGRIFTFGIAGTLSCLDAKTGKLQWRKQFGSPDFGVATSPIVDRGLVIAYVGAAEGALTAFDAATGAEKWSWKGDGPAYASPIVVEIAGARQVVTQSRQHIVSVAAPTGELLWQIPFKTAYDQNIVTPVLYRDTLIFSGTGNPVIAVKPIKQGAKWTAETVWQNKDFPMYMSSPVLSAGGLLFGFSERKRGEFFCLQAEDGTPLWNSDGRQGDNAAIVAAGSVWLISTPDGNLIVARQNNKAWEPLRKYTVADSPVWAHPVVMGTGILIKDATTLALWQP
jgi:outer membrane protein assembly factor BamB